MKRSLVFLCLCCQCLCGLCFSCKHAPPVQEGALPLKGVELDLWTDGEMLFAWGQIEGQKARVVFSSADLGNALAKNKHCAVGRQTGKVVLEGKERKLMRLSWGLEGRAQGNIEAALEEAWKVPSPSKLLRLRDGFVVENDDTPCVLRVGVQEMGTLQMAFEKGRLKFEEAGFAAKGEQIRFSEHPQWGIPFGQFIAFMKGKQVPLRLVLETSQWPSHVHENVFLGQSIFEEDSTWEELKLSAKTGLPAGSFKAEGGARLGRYWPWAEGSLGMKAFECCRLVWSPREGVATLQLPEEGH